MIRPAKKAEYAALAALAYSFYEQMDFDRFGYHFERGMVEESFYQNCEESDFIVLVHEDAGKVDGIVALAIRDRNLYFKGRRFAQEIVWHADPTLTPLRRARIMLELLDAADAERLRRGVEAFYLGYDIRPEFANVAKALEKRGFLPMCGYCYKGV